jgi:hypothetical protein
MNIIILNEFIIIIYSIISTLFYKLIKKINGSLYIVKSNIITKIKLTLEKVTKKKLKFSIL